VKLGWLHDYRLSQRIGGAQLTNAQVIDCAPSWFEVVECYPGQMREADAYVLNNVKLFSPAELQQATAGVYFKFEHDYWDCYGWQRAIIPEILTGARGVVFLSPLHAETFLDKWNVKPRRLALVPSSIDITPFRMLPDYEREGVLWIGEMQPHKGVQHAAAWADHTRTRVDFYGMGPEKPCGEYVQMYGQVAPEDVPALMARYSGFCFFPVWNEPFGRTVAEAVMAGCELHVTEEKIGALSWKWKYRGEWMAAVSDAPVLFWKTIGSWL